MNPENRDKVVHNYQDRSKEPDPEPKGEGGKAIPLGMDHNFPTKLHYMLSCVEADGQSHVISWQPHGRCFMVHDMKEFVLSMLPLWFRQSKFASFQRQLNLYGFQRITQGRDKGGYYHEYMLRNRPGLAQKIVRTKVKGRGARKASSPETEPKLYEFPWMPETQRTAPSAAHQDQAAISASNPNQRISPTLAALANLAPAPTPVVSLAQAPSPSALAGAIAMAQKGGPRSLGDALGFLGALSMPSQATTPLPGGEPMFLPSPASTLNTFLSSFGPAPPTPAPLPTSATSRYVPIAPAPPAQEGEPYKPRLEATNAYSSVLAALKAQHRRPSSLPRTSFTSPGPAPF